MLSTEALDILLDPATGDLKITNGDITFSTGLAAKAQALRIAVQMFRGEWFLDPEEGVPYFARDNVPREDALLGGKFNEARALASFRAALLTVDDVEILALSVALDKTRTLRVTWKVRTSFGDIAESLLLGGKK